jgi:quercetin dioxygenase-like cupin family protein
MRKRSKPRAPAPKVLDDPLVAQVAAGLKPSELSASSIDAMHERILQRIQEQAPDGTFTIRAADMQWVSAGPGVEVKVLRRDAERNDQTVLIRMQPGSVVVGHRHTQEEECLILEGEVFIGNYRLAAGDMHVARPGVVHAAIRAPHGALLMIRSEMPPSSFRIA